jgi:hypothetical protein
MRPTDRNHSGVEDHDHRAVAHLTEYHVLFEALDRLFQRINRDKIEISQADWLEMSEQMAASLSYRDNCERCSQVRYPYAVRFTNPTWLRCDYQCVECRRHWTCGYEVNVADYL